MDGDGDDFGDAAAAPVGDLGRRHLARQRQAAILEEVRRHGSARVGELTARFGVSDMTVRRDIGALAAAGLVERVHGGAVRGAAPAEPGFTAKAGWEPAAKERIAAAAAGLVRPGTAVGLSGGTTTHALAVELAARPELWTGLTVVTNSPRTAEVLEQAVAGRVGPGPPPVVILTGGLRTPSDALVGPLAERALAGLHVDQLFLGCHGVDPDAGLTTPNLAEAETNRAFVRAASRVTVVMDHTKWRTVGLSSFAALEDVHTLVADAGFPPPARRTAAGAVGRVVVADA